MSVHEALKMVDICVGDYKNITQNIGNNYTLIYMDPPYRPLSGSACFIEYTRNTFDDSEQKKLKVDCDLLTEKGYKIMQSNSNSLNSDGESFFEKLYDAYNIKQIKAHRFINAHAGKREKETELLIMNY
jgi:DNA adenine methylase